MSNYLTISAISVENKSTFNSIFYFFPSTEQQINLNQIAQKKKKSTSLHFNQMKTKKSYFLNLQDQQKQINAVTISLQQKGKINRKLDPLLMKPNKS